MPTAYSVVMHQAVYVDSLGSNALETGTGGREEKLQSCSAVIMVNEASGAASLYHFPAGHILKRKGAQKLLVEVGKQVQPSYVTIRYGTDFRIASNSGYEIVASNAEDEAFDWLAKLSDFIVAKLKISQVDTTPAQAGQVWVEIPNGSVVVKAGQTKLTITDLRSYQSGKYDFGRIYWDKD